MCALLRIARIKLKPISRVTVTQDIVYDPPTLPAYIPVQLKPVDGPPSNEEIASVHTALRISESFANVPSIFDSDLHVQLSQHLFDLQLARHVQRSIVKRLAPASVAQNQAVSRSDPGNTNVNNNTSPIGIPQITEATEAQNPPVNRPNTVSQPLSRVAARAASFVDSDVIYDPPSLPAHIPIELKPVTGPPSNEEVASVHAALRISESFVNVPSIFDPDLHIQLSQHLFDIQLARHVQRSITRRSASALSASNNQTVPQGGPAETDASNPPVTCASPSTTPGQVVESTETRYPPPEQPKPSYETASHPNTSETNERHKTTDLIVEIRDALKNVNRLLVGTQNSLARGFNSSKVSYCSGNISHNPGAHSLMNDHGEVPESYNLPTFTFTQTFTGSYYVNFSVDNLTENVLARYLQFYGIGEEMIEEGEELKIKSVATMTSQTSATNNSHETVTLVPPELPPLLASLFNLKPIHGNPSGQEVRLVHEAVRALNNFPQTSELRNTDLSIELSQHLFDIQMVCHRQKYPIISSALLNDVIYDPPTLPAYIPIELKPVTGPPSNEEIGSVHTALRISESFVNVPSIFDPDTHVQLSQHLFDIQLARHIERSITRRSARAPSVPINQSVPHEDSTETSATNAPGTHTSSVATSGQAVESTETQHPPPERPNPPDEITSHPNPSETNELCGTADLMIQIRDKLDKMTRVLVGTQNSLARGFNSSIVNSNWQYKSISHSPGVHSLINNDGEVPESHGLPTFAPISSGGMYSYVRFSLENLTENIVARYLRFYSIGEEMIEESEEGLKIKSDMLSDAKNLLSKRLFLNR
ncbi:Cytadherence high molecular weight protein 1 [Rhizoctonia solani]|uniref:Cytadherence high molecular weight protein 1 n=1 Tax=Rhizoctonia solani TaxID=456999 RepID=A0A0K6FTP6_9AGAM|nr:Cytadherence high molecular weight protein 1 [Rhizoctonia solani]